MLDSKFIESGEEVLGLEGVGVASDCFMGTGFLFEKFWTQR